MVNSFSIPTLDKDLPRLLQDEINGKTKPLGSLGQLEHLALQIGHIQGTLKPKIQKPSLLIFAADHGVVKAGVSPYPQSVTASMLKNFAAGGAAINVLARQLGWELKLINSGTVEALDLPGVIDLRIGSGTHNFLEKPAMSQAELEQAIRTGAELIHELAKQGCNTVAFGEMGIGNSSSAALLIHCLADVPMAKAVSRGAGCNELQFKRKQDVLEQACQLHGRITEAFEALRVFGGFELAMIVGAALAAAEHKMLILVDGLIVSSAILVALKAYPSLQTYLVFAHCSAAQGHKEMLEYIGARPLLNLDLQLGEGSGAALALPLVQSAVAILQDMASFASAEIAEKIES
ncbi:MAG: nicotinate-nucleotide--dimethylbenzimidazole phosphoribosyltransferase [Proteobacteria bacterium]|nr:nicotinate-nucleotide--dimethylbenzimidazole phosphoribosyltransferase [Pseudomonadota bacterium]